jgi:CRISPR-associated protein Csh1
MVLKDVDNEMTEVLGEYWDNAMTFTKDKERIRANFNFLTVFNFIPIRKEKDKRNAALALFKAILERRRISPEGIFLHFTDLIQLHRFGRGGYNITPTSKDFFDAAARNAVFQYHAFFSFLKKIKLLDMEEKINTSAATLEENNTTISTFFERMGYSDEQRALFYLGRVLNSVARAQFDKGHKTKPVLQKINYNGMDAAALKRLHADLFEKCKQYEIFNYTDRLFSKFTDLFNDSPGNRWDKRMKPEESLFYLLSGYSFRSPKDAVEDIETLPNNTTEN